MLTVRCASVLLEVLALLAVTQCYCLLSPPNPAATNLQQSSWFVLLMVVGDHLYQAAFTLPPLVERPVCSCKVK